MFSNWRRPAHSSGTGRAGGAGAGAAVYKGFSWLCPELCPHTRARPEQGPLCADRPRDAVYTREEAEGGQGCPAAGGRSRPGPAVSVPPSHSRPGGTEPAKSRSVQSTKLGHHPHLPGCGRRRHADPAVCLCGDVLCGSLKERVDRLPCLLHTHGAISNGCRNTVNCAVRGWQEADP